MTVTPGRSLLPKDVCTGEEEESDVIDEPDTPSESEDNTSENETENTSTENESEKMATENELNENDQGEGPSTQMAPLCPSVHEYYVTEFKTQRNQTKYIAEILKIGRGGGKLTVKCLRRRGGD